MAKLRIDPPRLDRWVEGLGVPMWARTDMNTDAIYEASGLVPPRKLDPRDPDWEPCV